MPKAPCESWKVRSTGLGAGSRVTLRSSRCRRGGAAALQRFTSAIMSASRDQAFGVGLPELPDTSQHLLKRPATAGQSCKILCCLDIYCGTVYALKALRSSN